MPDSERSMGSQGKTERETPIPDTTINLSQLTGIQIIPDSQEDLMSKYVGPIASYMKDSRWRIWQNVPHKDIFAEPIFLTMENDSS